MTLQGIEEQSGFNRFVVGVLRTFGRIGDNLGHFARPRGMAIDRAGYVYVVDAAFNNVQVFTPGVGTRVDKGA